MFFSQSWSRLKNIEFHTYILIICSIFIFGVVISYAIQPKSYFECIEANATILHHQEMCRKKFPPKKLPFASLQLEGRSGIQNGRFFARIYNGSDWFLTDIIIKFCETENKNCKLYSLEIDEMISPLSVKDLTCTIYQSNPNYEWSIESSSGYKK